MSHTPAILTRTSHFLAASPARRRMVVLGASAFLLCLCGCAFDVVMPLWVTRELGYSPGEWAHLRAIRMVGVLVGVLLLGAVSDRLGARRSGAVSMVGVALALVAMALLGGRGLALAMSIFGALMSTVFVNLNVLAQQVSERRQGVANSVYRSIGAAAGIAAPASATALAACWGGYPTVLLAGAALLVIGAVVLLRFEDGHSAAGGPPAELGPLFRGYVLALRHRPFVWMVNLSLLWANALIGVGTFVAIRFTSELGLSDQEFGQVASLCGGVSLVAVVASTAFLDRVSLRKLCAAAGSIAGASSAIMGVSDSPVVTASGLVAFSAANAVLIAPISMWISRARGPSTQGAAFSVHKVITAAYVALATALVGIMEPHIGMRAVFLVGGISGTVLGLLFLALAEPPRVS